MGDEKEFTLIKYHNYLFEEDDRGTHYFLVIDGFLPGINIRDASLIEEVEISVITLLENLKSEGF